MVDEYEFTEYMGIYLLYTHIGCYQEDLIGAVGTFVTLILHYRKS